MRGTREAAVPASKAGMFGAEDGMDTFNSRKRSWIMAQVKSTGNRSTEESLLTVLRQGGITGWRRAYPLFGKPDIVFPKARVAVFVGLEQAGWQVVWANDIDEDKMKMYRGHLADDVAHFHLGNVHAVAA